MGSFNRVKISENTGICLPEILSPLLWNEKVIITLVYTETMPFPQVTTVVVQNLTG